MKRLFDWLLPATKRDLEGAMGELREQVAQLRALIAQVAPLAPPLNRKQKIFGQLVPHQEDTFTPARLDDLEASLGQDADLMKLPEDLELGGNEGSWGGGNGSPSSSAVVITHVDGTDIERRSNELPAKCGEEFTIFAIERWDSACPPANYAEKLREAQLRALRQAYILCQQLVQQGMLCERVVFVDWSYIGWKCPDARGKAVIGAVMRFQCIGA